MAELKQYTKYTETLKNGMGHILADIEYDNSHPQHPFCINVCHRLSRQQVEGVMETLTDILHSIDAEGK